MALRIRFSGEKNELLRATRGICFDDVLAALETDGFLADISNPSSKYPQQRIFVVKIKAYIYAVPYVLNTATNELFLKTVYPSRSLTKRYLQKKRKAK